MANSDGVSNATHLDNDYFCLKKSKAELIRHYPPFMLFSTLYFIDDSTSFGHYAVPFELCLL